MIVGVMTPFEIINEGTGQRAEGLTFTWALDRVPPTDPPDRIEPIAANGGNAANLTGLTKGEIALSVTVAGFPNIILATQITIVDPPKPGHDRRVHLRHWQSGGQAGRVDPRLKPGAKPTKSLRD